ncbi:hypothetical protein ACTHQ4_10250 [Alkalicoccobacillus gibsonii]|uniref:hypothetical protein n=1 Tax=Alkalicoccobacillus gibsonii TaxID=79881 RepID=UPI003F7C4D38
MSDIQSVISKMQRVQKRLDESSRAIYVLAQEKAEAEREYRVALSQRILILRTEKFPATLINDIAKGEKEIAMLRLKRDIAKEKYKSGLESMNNVRTEASLLQSILKWQNDIGG